MVRGVTSFLRFSPIDAQLESRPACRQHTRVQREGVARQTDLLVGVAQLDLAGGLLASLDLLVHDGSVGIAQHGVLDNAVVARRHCRGEKSRGY
jgi:hypothetical protein